MPLRETLDVQLVEDGVAPWHVRRTHLAPVEAAIDHFAAGHVGCAVVARALVVVPAHPADE
jgi:hypothetical protein